MSTEEVEQKIGEANKQLASQGIDNVIIGLDRENCAYKIEFTDKSAFVLDENGFYRLKAPRDGTDEELEEFTARAWSDLSAIENLMIGLDRSRELLDHFRKYLLKAFGEEEKPLPDPDVGGTGKYVN